MTLPNSWQVIRNLKVKLRLLGCKIRRWLRKEWIGRIIRKSWRGRVSSLWLNRRSILMRLRGWRVRQRILRSWFSRRSRILRRRCRRFSIWRGIVGRIRRSWWGFSRIVIIQRINYKSSRKQNKTTINKSKTSKTNSKTSKPKEKNSKKNTKSSKKPSEKKREVPTSPKKNSKTKSKEK